MPHTAIVGMSGCGKTYLARQMAAQATATGRPVIVLDPKGTRWDGAQLVETDPHRFLSIAKASRGCLVVIDEAGVGLDRNDRDFDWFATMSREWGHNCVFLTQRAAQVHPNIRENCYKLALFKCSAAAARTWAEEFAQEELARATSLERFVFYWADRFDGCRKVTLQHNISA